jgi:hypothetical protein
MALSSLAPRLRVVSLVVARRGGPVARPGHPAGLHSLRQGFARRYPPTIFFNRRASASMRSRHSLRAAA